MDLLHSYILRKNPAAFVTQVWSWPRHNGAASDTYIQVIDPQYPHRTAPAFLLFDDAQDTFWDEFFWSRFIKDIADRADSPYRAALFCSYGSPTGRPLLDTTFGTPPVLTDATRVTLQFRPRPDGMQASGLLLNSKEFDEVVSLFDRELRIDGSVSQVIFDWTLGHVGAVLAILSYLLVRVCALYLQVNFSSDPPLS